MRLLSFQSSPQSYPSLDCTSQYSLRLRLDLSFWTGPTPRFHRLNEEFNLLFTSQYSLLLELLLSFLRQRILPISFSLITDPSILSTIQLRVCSEIPCFSQYSLRLPLLSFSSIRLIFRLCKEENRMAITKNIAEKKKGSFQIEKSRPQSYPY